MFSWITDFARHVERHPKHFNRLVKDNVSQVKELLSRKEVVYKEADPLAFQQFARLFRHREGVWAGLPIELNREQKYIAACILGIKVWNEREKRYVRYFNELNLFVARKWGKDTFIVPLISYFVGIDKEPSAWCQILAENENQAKRTFDIVKENIKTYPLSEWFTGTKKTSDKIECPATNGKIEYLSGRTKGKDGSNPSVAVVNEAHEITNKNQYNAVKTGMGGRSQPMMIVISSAGITPDSLYEFLLERDKKILHKKKLGKGDRIFALIFSIDDEDDYRDESCWIKANPSMYEGRPTLEFLQSQWEAMQGDPAMRSTFIAKHLNRQIGASIEYFDILTIRNAMRKILPDEYTDTYATGGVDLAETTDLCNATATILAGEKLLELQAYFIAEERLARNSGRDKRDYESMRNLATEDRITSELVIVTPGSYVRKEYVTAWFCLLRDVYKINFLKIGYDRALSKEWLTDMQEQGFSHEIVVRDKEKGTITRDYGILTEVAQGGWSLSGPIKIIRSLFEEGKIVADERNKLFAYCFYCMKVRQDANNNLSPHKAKSTGHIDGAIGVLNAFVAYMRAKELKLYRERLNKLFVI